MAGGGVAGGRQGTQFACFTGTKVQILTQKVLRCKVMGRYKDGNWYRAKVGSKEVLDRGGGGAAGAPGGELIYTKPMLWDDGDTRYTVYLLY